MYDDVHRWRSPPADGSSDAPSHLSSLRWSASMQSAHAPVDAAAQSAVRSWARIQRAGDALRSAHDAAKKLHQLEMMYADNRQQQVDAEMRASANRRQLLQRTASSANVVGNV